MPPRSRPKPVRRRTFLKEWREHRNLTQEQAAELLAIDQSTLSRLERVLTPYDQDFLERAANTYQCDPVELLIRNPLINDPIWTIIDRLRKASAADQERAAAIIDALLKKAS